MYIVTPAHYAKINELIYKDMRNGKMDVFYEVRYYVLCPIPIFRDDNKIHGRFSIDNMLKVVLFAFLSIFCHHYLQALEAVNRIISLILKNLF